MKKNSDNLYIKLLKFGNTKTEGFSHKEISDWGNKNLNTNEQKITDQYLQNSHTNYQRSRDGGIETMFILKYCNNRNDYRDEKNEYYLNLECYFKYIDYLELQEARESSKQANNKAFIAIIISIITMLISIFLTIWQINSPTKIDNEQFNKIYQEIKQ